MFIKYTFFHITFFAVDMKLQLTNGIEKMQ
jgi:hypothetical protein